MTRQALKGLDHQNLVSSNIVSRGDWLWKSAIFKARNNRAVSDVERTLNVIAKVHKPKHTFK